MALHFTPTESTISYFEAIDKYLSAHGKPVALYSDKAGVFYVKNRSETAGKGVTQFGRALYQLDIEAFCANTRQAKMRVERANLTLQDRLVKELRLREISTWEAANAYAPSSIADFNRRFAKPPAGDHNAHRSVRDDEDLRQILAYRVPRKVTNALTVQYDRVMYLLQDTAPNRKLIHQYVEVVELAEVARLSVPHFKLLFRRTFGTPVHQFVVEKRVERAKRLLDCRSARSRSIAAARMRAMWRTG